MVADRNRLSTPAVHSLQRLVPACALADGTCSSEQDHAPISSESCLDAIPAPSSEVERAIEDRLAGAIGAVTKRIRIAGKLPRGLFSASLQDIPSLTYTYE